MADPSEDDDWLARAGAVKQDVNYLQEKMSLLLAKKTAFDNESKHAHWLSNPHSSLAGPKRCEDFDCNLFPSSKDVSRALKQALSRASPEDVLTMNAVWIVQLCEFLQHYTSLAARMHAAAAELAKKKFDDGGIGSAGGAYGQFGFRHAAKKLMRDGPTAVNNPFATEDYVEHSKDDMAPRPRMKLRDSGDLTDLLGLNDRPGNKARRRGGGGGGGGGGEHLIVHVPAKATQTARQCILAAFGDISVYMDGLFGVLLAKMDKVQKYDSKLRQVVEELKEAQDQSKQHSDAASALLSPEAAERQVEEAVKACKREMETEHMQQTQDLLREQGKKIREDSARAMAQAKAENLRLAALVAEHEEARGGIVAAEGKLAELRELHTRKEKENMRKVEQLTSALRAKEALLKERRAEDAEMFELQKQLDVMRAGATAHRKELNAALDKASKAQSAMREVQAEVAAKDKLLQGKSKGGAVVLQGSSPLAKQLSSAEKRCAALERELAQLRAEAATRTTATATMGGSEAKLDTLEKAKLKAESEARQFKQQVDELRAHLELPHENSGANHDGTIRLMERAKLEQLNHELKRDKEKLADESKELQQQLEQQKQGFKELQQQLDQEIKRAETATQTAAQDSQRAQKMLKEHQQRTDERTTSLETRLAQMEAAHEKTCDELVQEKVAAEYKARQLTKELTALTNTQKSERVQSDETVTNNLEKTKRLLEEELRDDLDRETALRITCEQQQAELKRLMKEIQKEAEMSDKAGDKVAQKIAHLEKQLTSAHTRVEEATKRETEATVMLKTEQDAKAEVIEMCDFLVAQNKELQKAKPSPNDQRQVKELENCKQELKTTKQRLKELHEELSRVKKAYEAAQVQAVTDSLAAGMAKDLTHDMMFATQGLAKTVVKRENFDKTISKLDSFEKKGMDDELKGFLNGLISDYEAEIFSKENQISDLMGQQAAMRMELEDTFEQNRATLMRDYQREHDETCAALDRAELEIKSLKVKLSQYSQAGAGAGQDAWQLEQLQQLQQQLQESSAFSQALQSQLSEYERRFRELGPQLAIAQPVDMRNARPMPPPQQQFAPPQQQFAPPPRPMPPPGPMPQGPQPGHRPPPAYHRQ